MVALRRSMGLSLLVCIHVASIAGAQVGERYAENPAAEDTSSAGRQLARLVLNPEQGEGLPPYALADQAGEIQRYVEPVPGVELEPYVNQVVIVKHDTGRTLLASQLELPGNVGSRTTQQSATNDSSNVRPTQYVEPTEYPGAVPDLAEPVDSQILPPPSEVAPAEEPYVNDDAPPGVEPIYLDGPHGNRVTGPHEVYTSCSHNCACNHCQSRRRYRDRGLFAGVLDDCCRPTGCAPGARGRFYVRAEYLQWWFDGMDVPPLVVQGTINSPDAVDTTPEDDTLTVTDILYGGSELLDEERHGGRLTFGLFMDPCGFSAIEGDYLSFGSESDSFFVEGDPIVGDPNGQIGIGRPFFRIPPGLDGMGNENDINAFEDVVFTGIGGSVAVDLTSDFETAGLRWRHNLCCLDLCQPGCCDTVGCGDTCCGSGCGSGGCCGGGSCCRREGVGTRRVDMTFGLRYANLEERIAIVEDLEAIDGTTFFVMDSFGTDNDFLGGELGFVWEWEYCRWKVDLLSRLAIGNTRQRVVINGSTSIEGAAPLEGGLLAQSTNIGSFESDKLSVLPELGITLGYQLTCNLSFTAGYSFMYWSNVVRPGNQIDLDVNPMLIPRDNAVPIVPAANDRPRLIFDETDFFAHGLNFGLEYRR